MFRDLAAPSCGEFNWIGFGAAKTAGRMAFIEMRASLRYKVILQIHNAFVHIKGREESFFANGLFQRVRVSWVNSHASPCS